MKLKPIRDYVILRILSSKERTRGKIIIPATVRSLDTNQIDGIVVAIGDGRRLKNGEKLTITGVDYGDKVLVHKWAGTKFWVDNNLYMRVHVKEIFCVFED